MSRLFLIALTGTAVAIMWVISALANFVHGYGKGGGDNPVETLLAVFGGNFEAINHLALLFGTGSIASDMIKASALILVGMAVGYRRWGVAALALCLWFPSQIYSAYSVTGFVSQVMGDAIAKRERIAHKAELAQKLANTDVERLTWLSKQGVKGVGRSARRARDQVGTQYKEQRAMVQSSIETLGATKPIVAPDAAAALWQHVLPGWTTKDVTVASMIGLSAVIELVAGVGFFLLSMASTMGRPPAPVVQQVRIVTKLEAEPSPPPPADRVKPEAPSNVVNMEPPVRHMAGFRKVLQDAVGKGRMSSEPSQSEVRSAYFRYCKERKISNPINPTDLPDALSELGIESGREGKSRRIVYQLRNAA
jgi:hypothetical protein